MCGAIVGPRRQIKLWTKPYQKPARCLACLISMMSGSSGQRGYHTLDSASCFEDTAARPCGSPGWTLNFSMRDQVQVMSLQGKRLRAFQDRWCTPDGRLLENTDCSVLFKDCRGLLLLRTDEWHSKLQTQASEGALHRLVITV